MVDGMEINVPPKGDRLDLSSRSAATDAAAPNPSLPRSAVVIETVLIRNANLAILPKDKTKVPLRFYISRLRLDSAGLNTAMRYHADLTNPKPPGDIHSIGTFGPWSADEPSNTPLTGDYTFNNADLGVFKAIAGILKSRAISRDAFFHQCTGRSFRTRLPLETSGQPRVASHAFSGACRWNQRQHHPETCRSQARKHALHLQRRRD